jgi:cold shock CspA family protein
VEVCVAPLGCDARTNKKAIARNFRKIVIWFNARKEYGFIKRIAAKDDILLPIRRSSRKSLQPVGNGENVW